MAFLCSFHLHTPVTNDDKHCFTYGVGHLCVCVCTHIYTHTHTYTFFFFFFETQYCSVT